jgi:methylmalonyl-CoA mutase C-terminal domain/subunit
MLVSVSSIRTQVETQDRTMDSGRPKRILIGKVGLDGHDRGAKFIVRALRNAGYEVIYTGIRRTPEQIVRTAVDEDVDAIGLSLLSGAHKELVTRVAELLKTEEAAEIMLFAGGIIPEQDIPYLKSLGFRHVFTPGIPLSGILAALEAEFGSTTAAGSEADN